MSNVKKRALKGVLWSSIDRFSTQGVQFVIGIILARLLTPDDYGLIGILTVFLMISMTFIDSGFSNALIQKKSRDEKDFSTVFFFNIGVGVIAYLLLCLLAPFIADFYDRSELSSLTRVVGVVLIVNSFSVVQRAQLTLKLDFKTQAKATLSSIIISGAIGICAAYAGCGVWALVIQVVLKSIIETTMLWVLSKWMPTEHFDYNRFKKLFKFGSKLLLSGLIDTVYKNIYIIVIGKMFTSSELGFYTRAKQFNELPSSNVTGVIQRVSFPLLSEVQDDNQRLQSIYRKMIITSSMIIFPLMTILSALSLPIIELVLTKKWSEVAWMLQLLCFAGMLYPVHALNLNVLNVKGRSDLFLRVEVIKKIIITIVLLITIPMGIKALIVGQIVTSYIGLIINTFYTKKIINYSLLMQVRDIFPYLMASFISFVSVYYVTTLCVDSNIIEVLLGGMVGILVYFAIIWMIRKKDIIALATIKKDYE